MQTIIHLIVFVLTLTGTVLHTAISNNNPNIVNETKDITGCPIYSERAEKFLAGFLKNPNIADIKNEIGLPVINTSSIEHVTGDENLTLCNFLHKEMGIPIGEYDEYSFFEASGYYFIIRVLKPPALGLSTIVIFNNSLEEIGRFSG